MVSSVALSLLFLPSYTLAAFNLLNVADQQLQIPFNGDNEACLAAYNATIDCDESILKIGIADEPPTEEQLDNVCTATCLNSLRKWVRGGPGCEGTEYFAFFGLTNGTQELFGNEPANAANLQQYWVTSTYHKNCLVSLDPKPDSPKYCVLTNTTSPADSYFPAYFDVSNPDQLCKDNSCAAQGAYLWSPINYTYRYDSTGKQEFTSEDGMIGYDEACPDGPTTGFPKREQDITAEELSNAGDEPIVVGGATNGGNDSNSPPSDGDNNSSNADPTGNNTTDDNASPTGADSPTGTGGSGSQESTKPNAAVSGKAVEFSVFISAVVGAAVYMLL